MNKRKIAFLAIMHLACDLNRGALPAILPFLVLAYSYNYRQTAAIMFCYSIVASLTQPVFGWMSDRRPSALYIPLGLACAGLGIATIGYSPFYWATLLGAALGGIGCALFHPEAAYYANVFAGHRKGIALSIFSIGGNGGFILGPVLVGALLPLTGLSGTLTFAGLGLISALMVFVIFARIPAAERRKMKDALQGKGKNDWKRFAILSGVVINRSIVFLSLNAFLSLYWISRFGWSARASAFVLAFFSLVGVASNLSGGILSDRVGYIRILRITQGTLMPAVVAFTLASNPYVAAVLLMPIAFCIYASYSPMIILGQTYLSRNIAFASGVTLGLAQSAGGLVMPVMGWVADTWGLTNAFLGLGAVAALGFFATLLLREPVPAS